MRDGGQALDIAVRDVMEEQLWDIQVVPTRDNSKDSQKIP